VIASAGAKLYDHRLAAIRALAALNDIKVCKLLGCQIEFDVEALRAIANPHIASADPYVEVTI
jgi:hypothetical protein